MKSASMLLSSLFVVGISLVLAAETQRGTARRGPAVALRGRPEVMAVALARLDPEWWKATTPTTTAAPGKAPAGNASTNATAKGKKGTSGPADIFAVQIEKCTEFLNVPGTFLANSEYWKNECKAVPKDATYIKMTLGEVSDYFKPIATKSMCDMFSFSDEHMWSSDGETWSTPKASAAGLGGSKDGWLTAQKSSTDKRDTPSFWGDDSVKKQTGGCCYADYTASKKAWAKPFKMEYCGVPKALAPICTPLTTVAGSFSADKDFWTQTCKTIPMTASFVKVAMGSTVDFYRPPTGKTFCEMLTTNDVHKWSKDGVTWVTPKYDTTTSMKGFGGSADNGLTTGDARTKVSFWGSDVKTNTGGCCYASLTEKKQGFGKSFTMSYCEIPTPPPVAQLVSELHSTEASVQALEKELHNIHTRLLGAEGDNVDAAGNVSLARSGMYQLAAKARNEADDLQELALRTSMSGSNLDLMENQLANSEKRVAQAAESAKATAKIVQKVGSQKGLKKQDKLNEKIWKLLDPSNKDSLDATEKSLRVMEKDTDKFRGQVGGEVKTVMVSKLRRTVHRLRKAIHRLGTAGAKADSALGATESSAPLGADLGLDDV